MGFIRGWLRSFRWWPWLTTLREVRTTALYINAFIRSSPCKSKTKGERTVTFFSLAFLWACRRREAAEAGLWGLSIFCLSWTIVSKVSGKENTRHQTLTWLGSSFMTASSLSSQHFAAERDSMKRGQTENWNAGSHQQWSPPQCPWEGGLEAEPQGEAHFARLQEHLPMCWSSPRRRHLTGLQAYKFLHQRRPPPSCWANSPGHLCPSHCSYWCGLETSTEKNSEVCDVCLNKTG